MDDAVFFQILETIEEILKETSFAGFDNIPDLPADSIQIRDGLFDTRDTDEEQWKDEPVPAMFITPATEVSRPAEEGTNIEDDITYRVLVQICDHEEDRFNRDRLRTHLRWVQDISRLFHGKDWTVLDFDGGCPVISWAQNTRLIDPSAFWKHNYFVRGTIVDILSREPRTIT